MKDVFIRSVVFFSAAYFFLAVSAINTNTNSFGDNNNAPPTTYF